jgi:hypothetical protein
VISAKSSTPSIGNALRSEQLTDCELLINQLRCDTIEYISRSIRHWWAQAGNNKDSKNFQIPMQELGKRHPALACSTEGKFVQRVY